MLQYKTCQIFIELCDTSSPLKPNACFTLPACMASPKSHIIHVRECKNPLKKNFKQKPGSRLMYSAVERKGPHRTREQIRLLRNS